MPYSEGMETQQLFSIHGLSLALQLPRIWLANEADAGRIPCLRIGRRRLFNLEAVRRVLAELRLPEQR